MTPPRIDQAVAGMHGGDAITRDALAIRDALRRAGFESEIFCNVIHRADDMRREGRDPRDHRGGPDDLMIYHFSIASPLTDWFLGLRCRRLVRYHNITPAEHWVGVDDRVALQLRQGRMTLPRLAEVSELAICVSEFNAADLRSAGFERTAVVPIGVDVKQFDRPADAAVLGALRADPRPKILFVGRVVPNKCQEDLVKVMAIHHRVGRREALLNIVGSWGGAPRYHGHLEALVNHLELHDCVRFAGLVSAAALTAHFQAADLFVCLSEHEGFCVPLIEAMHHGIPIIAHASSAVPDTLGDAGILVRDKHLPAIAELIEQVLGDEDLRRGLRERGAARVRAFQPEVVERQFMEVIRPLVA